MLEGSWNLVGPRKLESVTVRKESIGLTIFGYNERFLESVLSVASQKKIYSHFNEIVDRKS